MLCAALATAASADASCGCLCCVPGKAQYLAGSAMCASNPFSIRLLAKCRPSGWVGPSAATVAAAATTHDQQVSSNTQTEDACSNPLLHCGWQYCGAGRDPCALCSTAICPHSQRCMQRKARVPQQRTAQHSAGASPHPKHWLLGVYAACTDSSSAPSGLMPACTAGCNMELHGLICSSSSMCQSSKRTAASQWVRWHARAHNCHVPAHSSSYLSVHLFLDRGAHAA